MPIPIRQTIDTSHPNIAIQITDDGSRTLIRRDTGDCYHSGCGAIAETRQVYLQNSGVADRLADRQPTSVLEIGLGTGMGLLQTLDTAIGTGTRIRYTACESDWVPADVLRELQLEKWLSHDCLAEKFIQFRESIPAHAPDGVYRWDVCDDDSITHSVDIHLGDLRRRDAVLLPLDAATPEQRYDAVYFDPFAPESNPELWELAFMERLYPFLVPGGRLVTYCVNRKVRDAMENVGFVVDRVPGPENGKREVMIATKK